MDCTLTHGFSSAHVGVRTSSHSAVSYILNDTIPGLNAMEKIKLGKCGKYGSRKPH